MRILKRILPLIRGFPVVFRGAVRHFFYRAKTLKVDTLQAFYGLQAKGVLHNPSRLQRKTQRKAIRLWQDTKAFDRIVALLGAAQYSIIVHMFIWRSDASGTMVARALLDAADRGVKVSITKDSVGDVFELTDSFIATKSSSDPFWKKFWNHPNVVIEYVPNHSHAKVFIIDDAVLLLTGMNLADEYRLEWHDYMMELWGPTFIESYLVSGNHIGDGVRVVVNRAAEKTIRPCIMRLLESAKHSIMLEQAYFSDLAINELLQRKSREGIHVTLILPSLPDVHHRANMESVARLMNGGSKKFIRIFLYPKMVHGKVILIDKLHALVGSANLNQLSLDDMGEACVLFDSTAPKTLLKLKTILLKDIFKSKEVDGPPRFSILRKMGAWMGL